MKRFKFNKLLVESPNPPQTRDVLWVDVDEITGEIKSIKENKNNEWKDLLSTNQDMSSILPLIGSCGVLYTTVDDQPLSQFDYIDPSEAPYISDPDTYIHTKVGNMYYYFERSIEGNIIGFRFGEEAFSGNKKLKSVVISDVASDIGKRCFYDCTSLEYISIPKGVPIGLQAFAGCTSLKTIIYRGTMSELQEACGGDPAAFGAVATEDIICNDGIWSLNEIGK